MPQIRVQVPGQGIVEFPEGTSEQEMRDALSKLPAGVTAARTRTWGDTATDLLPTVGGTIGAVAGGPIGAAMGGAAGTGFRQLVQHGAELPGAVRDIVGNLMAGGEPAQATQQGYTSGAQQGADQAGTQGAIQGAITAGGDLAAAGARRIAPALMQSALKPGLKASLQATKNGTVPPVVQTLLDEGVNVTSGGLNKLNAIIGESNQAIDTAIAAVPATETIAPLQVARRLSDTAGKFANQVNPQADLEAISQVGHNFLDAHGAQDVTAAGAQAMKQQTYRILSDKAYTGELKGAALEAEKALARGLKEEVATAAAKSGVDITAANAREGAAIAARDTVAKRVAMVGNRDPAGLSWLAHNPVTFLVMVAERSPLVKSLLARGLWSAAARASGMPTEALRYAVGAVASESGSDTPPESVK